MFIVECVYRVYEKQCVVYVFNNLLNVFGEFYVFIKLMESEKIIFVKCIVLNFSVFFEKLQEIIDYLESYKDDSLLGDFVEINDCIVDLGKLVLDMLKEL